jgi:hypothetical protein
MAGAGTRRLMRLAAHATTSPQLGTEHFSGPPIFFSGIGARVSPLESSMYKSSFVILGAALLAGATALPANAMVHQIGAVNVASDHYTNVSWQHFEGPVIRLRMVAQGDAIDCDHVAITYYDGTTHNVFSGMMVKDSIETITFPEGDSRIRTVDFACKAQSADGARIALSSVSEGWDHDNWAPEPHVTTTETDTPVVTR